LAEEAFIVWLRLGLLGFSLMRQHIGIALNEVTGIGLSLKQTFDVERLFEVDKGTLSFCSRARAEETCADYVIDVTSCDTRSAVSLAAVSTSGSGHVLGLLSHHPVAIREHPFMYRLTGPD
jgi:hypothetical protein